MDSRKLFFVCVWVLCAVATIVPAAVVSADEQPITGMQVWVGGGDGNGCHSSIGGPMIFGYLPEVGRVATEIVTATASVSFGEIYPSATIPIPLEGLVYSDGSAAPITDIFFSMRLDHFAQCGGPTWTFTYSGGSTIDVRSDWPNSVQFELVAVRQGDGPVALDTPSFGKIKAQYR